GWGGGGGAEGGWGWCSCFQNGSSRDVMTWGDMLRSRGAGIEWIFDALLVIHERPRPRSHVAADYCSRYLRSSYGARRIVRRESSGRVGATPPPSSRTSR